MTDLASRCENITVRGLRYRIRHWGPESAPRLIFLHGWMDSSPSFQFVVDALEHPWHVIAPDWRGFGGSQYTNGPYWQFDWHADLDRIVDTYSPDEPVRLIGHSRGGGIAYAYAAARPERVSRLVVLDTIGFKRTPSDDSAAQLRRWLDALKNPTPMRAYRDYGTLAERLMAANPRLTGERANFLARNASRERDDGQVEFGADPWHRIGAPNVYNLDEVMGYWRNIEAPTLLLIADDGNVTRRFGKDPDELAERIGCFKNISIQTIANSGHNLHHDQPECVARALETFLADRSE